MSISAIIFVIGLIFAIIGFAVPSWRANTLWAIGIFVAILGLGIAVFLHS